MIEVGTVLHETYKVARLLGQGGMGAVYEATHVRLPKRFAIKVLHTEVVKNAAAFGRFRREAEISSSLGHLNIIEVQDFNETPDGQPYIVMEFLEGEDLAAVLGRTGGKGLGLERTLQILRPVASALQAAHNAGIIHRDLKPQNIFMSKKGQQEIPKILDFGISKITGTTEVQTKTSAVMGTPGYMSPEQATGKNAQLDARSDQFSLGAMVYEMLAGKHAFVTEGADPVSILFRIVKEDPSPIEGVPDIINQIVFKAMAKDKDHRFPDVASFVQTLDDAAAGKAVSLAALGSRGGAAGGSKLVPVAILGVLLAFGGGAFYILKMKKKSPVSTANAAPALVQDAPRTPPPSTPTAPTPPEPEKVAGKVFVRFNISPLGAHAMVDGKPLTQPLLQIDRGAPSPKLRVEADGYETASLLVPTDRDQTLDVNLVPASPDEKKHASAKPKHSSGSASSSSAKKPKDDLENPF